MWLISFVVCLEFTIANSPESISAVCVCRAAAHLFSDDALSWVSACGYELLRGKHKTTRGRLKKNGDFKKKGLKRKQ